MKKRKIAVASALSPRFLSVLAEAARFSRLLEGDLHLIHAAGRTDEKEAQFREGIAAVGLPESTTVFWFDAASPADAILSVVEKEGVEVLVSGALERDSELRNFTGNVARELLLKCTCDLVLLPRPQQVPRPISRIAIVVDLLEPDVNWLRSALQLARREGLPHVHVLSILTPFDKTSSDNLPAASDDELEARLDALFVEAGDYEGECDCRIIRSNTGFNACEVIQTLEPDLLLAKRSSKVPDLTMPRHMDWLHQVIPSNVMISRS